MLGDGAAARNSFSNCDNNVSASGLGSDELKRKDGRTMYKTTG